MIHNLVEVKPETALTGAAGLTVGDWVEVSHDFSPGHNSGGGVGVITEVVGNLCHVRYVMDGHAEKFIPITRMKMIRDGARNGWLYVLRQSGKWG
jgi:hypothetical protein